MEQAELGLRDYTEIMHQSGLNYWQILRIVLILAEELYIKADSEYYVKGGKR